MQAAPTFALIAGEASGDLLGADLIIALRERYPDARFVGVCGPRMRAAGCEALADIEALSLFGIFEVLRHLPRLLRLRGQLRDVLLQLRPAAVIGIDAPDFNLRLEPALKAAGIPTVHYVSPTVWAWREGRVEVIRRAVDLILTLFPFEQDFYRRHAVAAQYVGHPLADAIPLQVDQRAARQQLGLPMQGKILALLPGSRGSEVTRLAWPFLETARLLCQRCDGLQLVVPLANARVRARFEAVLARFESLPIILVDGQSHTVLAACDAVLLASGTAALEALLHQRPMVVAYRINGLTYWVVRLLGLLKVVQVSLPNLLSAEASVPEFLQGAVQPQAMAAALQPLLDDEQAALQQTRAFRAVHEALRCNASRMAAQSIAELVEARQ